MNSESLRKALLLLFIKTKGGNNRIQIVKTLKQCPRNANQIAKILHVDYRTIKHHLRVLEKNDIVVNVGGGYATAYFLSKHMEENFAVFERTINCRYNENLQRD
jgi:predicted transcriptional regulator